MGRSSVRWSAPKLGYLIAIAAALGWASMIGLGSAPSRSQDVDYDHVIDLADKQRMLVEKMSKESILVALLIDADSSLKDLKESYDLFNSVRIGLRDGSASLGLPTATDPETLDRLALVEDLWPLFDGAIRNGIGSGVVGRMEIDTLAEMYRPLLEALDGTVEAYVAEATKRQLHSMRSLAISISGRQRMLSQKIAKEYLLIAYRHEKRRNTSRLKQSADLFDRSLKALLGGDRQQRLIAPPNPEIRYQLEKVEQLWQRFKPMIAPALAGRTLSEEEIGQVSALNAELLRATEQAVSLYKML